MKNLWILTEERPKKQSLEKILDYFAGYQSIAYKGGDLWICPLLNSEKCFDFTYEVKGFNSPKVEHVYIKTISGSSSFVDYLLYYQEKQPTTQDTPLLAIEETKTDDSESRNTGVYQRATKFVVLNFFYPRTKCVMLYSLHVEQKKKPTDTYIFGTRMLRTLGVDIIGKKLDKELYKPFSTIEELIATKQLMSKPKSPTNVPVEIEQYDDSISVSGRLYKDDRLAHDPSIGTLSLICATLRKLGWDKDIVITRHGLSQRHVVGNNKFLQIADKLHLSLQGLALSPCNLPDSYWHYEIKGEKLGTIFIHTVVENLTSSFSVFDNHAGCEKSYFKTADGVYIPLEKYVDRGLYKAGDKSKRLAIPDLVLIDIDSKESITIEGKTFANRLKGIEELKLYDSFEAMYLDKYYPHYAHKRTVVLYGSKNDSVIEVEIGFLLNQDGKMVLGINAPTIFITAIKNLMAYWN